MKTTLALFSFCFGIVLFLNSCSKEELDGLNTNYYKVRLYDDTLPDPRNHSNRIAASNGRLLMTYGYSFERFFFVNGAAIEAPPPRNVWMLTDNDGNLLKRDTFPEGLAIGDIVAMPDNSFLIVTFIGDYAVGGSYGGMQLMRLDPDGVMGAVDTLDLPTTGPISDLSTVHLSLAHNGNVLLYFGYYSQVGFGGAFVGEMTVLGDFLWQKNYADYIMTDCLAEPGGGYLMTSRLFDLMTYSCDGHLMKTNSTGDSLWSRTIDCVDLLNGQDHGIGQIVPAGNGNYRLGLCDYEPDHSRQKMHIYEFNESGEFLDTTIVALGPSYLIQKGNDGLFLLNCLDAIYGYVTDQFNSTYAILDANMNTVKTSTFQDMTTDLTNAGCRTSDGKIACFGITQSYDRKYYKPQLILMN